MMISPTELLPKLNDLYHTSLVRGHGTGWNCLDEYFTVKEGELTIVTGMPSHGKSEWLDNLIVNLALNHKYRIAVFSPENHPLEIHAMKIIEKLQQMPFYVAGRISEDEMLDATMLMAKHFAFVKPKESEFTPTHIINEALGWLDQSITSPRAVIIDPWNEMEHCRPDKINETEYISQILTELRRGAREYKTHLFLVAHPMKMLKDKDGNYGVPRPYDISGSAHWFNKADNCIAIWRDVIKNQELTEIHIQKVRFKTTGKVGMVELIYDKFKSSYFEPFPPQINKKTLSK